MTQTMRERLEAALAKPLAEANCIGCDDFDPWGDVIEGIYGGYSSECDDLMIEAMEAVRDKKTFDFMKSRGLAGELVLYILAGHQLTDYGTSPRGGWVDFDLEDLWQPLIDKWKAHAAIQWAPERP